MKKQLLSAIFCALLASPAFAAKGPEIDLVDNKLSIDAETVPLSRLLRLLDMATGLKSKVPPELANRIISVKFSGLTVDDGVRKIFQGQPLDYVMIAGKGVTVTAASQSIGGAETVPAYNSGPGQPEQTFVPDFQQQQLQQQQLNQLQQQQTAGAIALPGQQPQQQVTPFGTMPRGQQVPPNGALSAPGQNNSLFTNPFNQNQPQPGGFNTPNGQQASPTPFGTPFGTPLGIPSQPQGNPTLASPQLFPQH